MGCRSQPRRRSLPKKIEEFDGRQGGQESGKVLGSNSADVISTRKNFPIVTPDRAAVDRSSMTAFTRFCAECTGRDFPDYAALHAFSCAELERFWRLFLEWSRLSWEGGIGLCHHQA
jgi:hypothetical protein